MSECVSESGREVVSECPERVSELENEREEEGNCLKRNFLIITNTN